ncbi:MAG: hypothetical protein H0U56_15550 [Methylibium sp.]|nr:hypothetical protein [Methylibium sp.]
MMLLGVDPSLTGCGLVWGPSDFDFQWRRVRGLSLGLDLKRATTLQKLRRVEALANDLCEQVRRVRAERVWIEGQLAMGGAFNVPQLCELIGVLRHELLKQCGIVAESAPQSTVRKLVLGWLPQKDRKAAVVGALRAAGIVLDDDDQYDALTVWNHGLHELGAPCLTGLLGPKPTKPKAPRKRAAKGQAVIEGLPL